MAFALQASFLPSSTGFSGRFVTKTALRHNNTTVAKKTVDFVKYQGLGNDFLLIDNRDSLVPKISKQEAKTLCNRNFGVGGDGVIFVMPGTQDCDYTMRIYNSDGSEPQMCGNGVRCMARYIAELEGATEPRSYKIHTLAGTIVPTLREDGQIVVDMGVPQLVGRNIPTTLPQFFDGTVIKQPLKVDGKTWLVTCVGMGNPHCVTFGEEDEQHLFHLDSVPLEKLGPLFENHEQFPEKTNVEFVEVVNTAHLKAKVWERGVGPTLACGTGACAILVAACLEGRARKRCLIELPGGKLEVEWKADDFRVYMTGPAERVFSGIALL